MSWRTLQAKCSHVDHRLSPDQALSGVASFQQNRLDVLIDLDLSDNDVQSPDPITSSRTR
jgi:hypothetical protein